MADRRKKTNKRKSRKSRKTKRVGGSCGCEQKGGFGAQSMQPIPLRYFYAGNTYENDPTAPSAMTEGRNYSATGGRRRRRTARKMRGGVSADPILGAGNANLSFGTTQGAFSGAGVFHAENITNPAPTANPVLGWKGSTYV
jgi:hypothetical protein